MPLATVVTKRRNYMDMTIGVVGALVCAVISVFWWTRGRYLFFAISVTETLIFSYVVYLRIGILRLINYIERLKKP